MFHIRSTHGASVSDPYFPPPFTFASHHSHIFTEHLQTTAVFTMGKTKKSFISKKNASTYHLMHRSQRDVGGEVLNEGDTTSSGMLLWPSADNDAGTDQKVLFAGKSTKTMSDWREKLASAGLLDVDHEKYLKPISGTGTFLDATTGHVGDARAAAAPRAGTNMEEEALMEVDRQFDSIPLTADCMDEDIAEALYGDFDEADFEEINDDFVLDAAKEPEDGEEGGGGFDYDEHIKRLMEKAKLEREDRPIGAGARNGDVDFFSKLKSLNERDEEGEYPDDDSLFNGTTATTPGVVSALSPEAERALCEKFEETLLEYDSDELGDCPEEEIVGSRPLEGDAQLDAAMDDFLLEKEDDVFIHGSRNYLDGIKHGGSGFSALVGTHMVNAKDLGEGEVEQPPETVAETLANASARLTDAPVQPPAEEIFIDGKSYYSERMRNPFDCESILSTYSNLDNNPVTIGSGRGRRKKNLKHVIEEEPIQHIQLSNKTGLPLGVLPSRADYNDRGDDTMVSVNRGEARKKAETTEEKKARKAAIKMERQINRIQKKVTRELYNEEFQKRTGDVMADDVGGKSVFRYS